MPFLSLLLAQRNPDMLATRRRRDPRGSDRMRWWASAAAAGRVIVGAAVVLVSVRAAGMQRPSPAPSDDADGQYGNPANLDDYIAEMTSPARDAWQKPDQVVAALGLKKGETACDIGSGPGYFTLRLARA